LEAILFFRNKTVLSKDSIFP